MQKKFADKSISKFSEQVKHFFNREEIESIARSTNFVQRKSKLTGYLFVTAIMFSLLIYPTPTLEQLVGLLELYINDLELSREAIHQRINKYAVDFLKALLSRAMQIRFASLQKIKLLQQFKKIKIMDSTSFQLPENLAVLFPGSGGSASPAAAKIQFEYDLKSCEFSYLVENGNSPDNCPENSFLAKIHKKDLIIRDLGYFNIGIFKQIDEKGAYYLSRYMPRVNIFIKNENGIFQKIDLTKLIEKMEQPIMEVEIYFNCKDGKTKTRLIIEKVPDIVKNKRLRRINEDDRRKGRKTSRATRGLQCVNLLITNAPDDILTKEAIRALYSMRWQIELVFKNWKSNFHLDKYTGYRVERIECFLYSRLLLIFITTKIFSWIRNNLWNAHKAELSEFRSAKYLKIIANEWFRILISNHKDLSRILEHSILFIGRHCSKMKHVAKPHTLEIMNQLCLA